MIKIGIIGGAGYTAGELIRILLHHPKVQIDFIHIRRLLRKTMQYRELRMMLCDEL